MSRTNNACATTSRAVCDRWSRCSLRAKSTCKHKTTRMKKPGQARWLPKVVMKAWKPGGPIDKFVHAQGSRAPPGGLWKVMGSLQSRKPQSCTSEYSNTCVNSNSVCMTFAFFKTKTTWKIILFRRCGNPYGNTMTDLCMNMLLVHPKETKGAKTQPA